MCLLMFLTKPSMSFLIAVEESSNKNGVRLPFCNAARIHWQMDPTCRGVWLSRSSLCTHPWERKNKVRRSFTTKLCANSLARIFIGAVSIRRVRLMHCFPLLRHCVVVCFVGVIATIVHSIRTHHRTSRLIIWHLRSTRVVLMMPTAHLSILIVRLRRVLSLRRHNAVRRRLYNIVVFWWSAGAIVLVNNRWHRRCRCGTRRCYTNRRGWWELWWAFWIMTWAWKKSPLKSLNKIWMSVFELTIAGHTIILIAYILTTTFRWRWRWWFVLVAGRWARRVRWCVRWWVLIMLIICTRWDFIYTFAAARTMLAVFILLLVFRRRRSARGAPACRDDVRRHARATRIRNLCVGAGRGAFRCATAAARLFLFAAGRWGGCKSCRRKRIDRPVRRWTRRLMWNFRIFFGRWRRIAGVCFVGDRLVGWNRLHIAALFLKVLNNIIKADDWATIHSPICCNGADSIRSTWRCPSSCLLLHTTDPIAGHMLRETAACNPIYCTACRRQLLPLNPCFLPHRCSMLKEEELKWESRWMRHGQQLTFIIPLGWYQLKNDWLHSRHIAKSNFRNVKCTYDVRPSLIICFLQCTIARWTQLTTHSRRSFLWFTFSTVPRLKLKISLH